MPTIRNPLFDPLRKLGLTEQQVSDARAALQAFFAGNANRESLEFDELLAALVAAGFTRAQALTILPALVR